jgi:hypothetical protein
VNGGSIKIAFALIREPMVLGITVVFLIGFGLPLVALFSKVITDRNGLRSTIFGRCLKGDVSLWVVYWLFGIVGGILASLITLFISTASPILGMLFISVYLFWWSISLWQCALNAAFLILTYLVRGLLVFGFVIGVVLISGIVDINDAMYSRLSAVLISFVAIQFVLVYSASYYLGFSNGKSARSITHIGTSGYSE